MDKEILEKLTTQLTKQKEKLEKELSEVASKDPHNESNYEATFPDFGDEEEQNANEVGQFTTNLSIKYILKGLSKD